MNHLAKSAQSGRKDKEEKMIDEHHICTELCNMLGCWPEQIVDIVKRLKDAHSAGRPDDRPTGEEVG